MKNIICLHEYTDNHIGAIRLCMHMLLALGKACNKGCKLFIKMTNLIPGCIATQRGSVRILFPGGFSFTIIINVKSDHVLLIFWSPLLLKQRCQDLTINLS